MATSAPFPADSQRGATLIELMMALVVLAIGVLAVGQLFPAGQRTQVQDRMMTAASGYAQEKIEQLGVLAWSDPGLTLGRHPAGTATENLGNQGHWQRYYLIEALPAALPGTLKATVTVAWNSPSGSRQVQAITYVRR